MYLLLLLRRRRRGGGQVLSMAVTVTMRRLASCSLLLPLPIRVGARGIEKPVLTLVVFVRRMLHRRDYIKEGVFLTGMVVSRFRHFEYVVFSAQKQIV